MSATNEDFLFAQEAQNLGYVTEAQVEEGFLLQRRMAEDLRIDERLSVILVKRGWLADEQARRVRARVEPRGDGAQIEGYQLLSRLGRGAMGTVYKARHLRLNRIVAIKVLRRDLAADPTQVERLRGEAEMLASLDHPNIIRVLDAGESNGFPYFVMEYVEGDSLRDRIARDGPLGEEDALRVTRGLADALEKARRMGVVHRDVKPGNVLLTRQGVPKLMDLGLAKGPVDLGLTQHGATVGTPQFISPEQAQDPRKADTRSDIYSLGATLYAMLAGRPPFEGTTLAEIITKVLYEQPTPLRIVNSAISGEAAYLVERMMLKDPSLRYATPAEVVVDIDRIVGGRSIVPAGFTGNWEAWLLRRRLRVGARRTIVIVGTAIALGFGGALFLQHREREKAAVEADERARELLETTQWSDDDSAPPLDSASAIDARSRLHAQWRDRIGRLERRYREANDLEEELRAWEDQATRASAHRKAVDAHVKRLAEVYEDLSRLGLLLQTIEKPIAERRLGVAWAEFRRDGGAEAARASRWARAARSELGRVLQAVGSRELAGAVNDAAARLATATSLDELDRVARGHAERLAGDDEFPASGLLDAARREAARVAAAIERIALAAREADDKSSLDAARRAVRSADAADRHREVLATVRTVLVAKAGRELDTLAAHEGVQLGPPRDDVLRLVEEACDDALRRLRTAIGEALDERIATARDRLDSAGLAASADDRLLAAELERLAGEADRESLPNVDAARRRAAELRSRLGEHERRREELWEAALGEVFERILAGDAGGVRDVVARKEKEADAATGPDPRIASLRSAAEPLEALERGALESVDPSGTLDQLRLRPGAEVAGPLPERLVIRRVDLDQRGLVVADARSRQAATRFLPARAIHPEVLLAWARRPSGVSPEVEAFARLSALGPIDDTPGLDRRPALVAHESAARAFAELGADGGPWSEFVQQRRDRIRAVQESREAAAARAEETASRYLEEERTIEANEVLEDLLDEGGRLRYTQAFDERRQRIDVLLSRARDGLERDRLRALAPGARVRALDREFVEFRFDLDTPDVQKRNILHGLGEFVREADGGAVTPGAGTDPYALHLLKGAAGPVHDRPLSFAQMFDPALRFEFEFTMHTLAGAPLVAVDMDGAKLAVASTDPRVLGRRLPPGIPPLDREKRGAPEWDIYGVGRGVGFQTTPLTTFGSSWLDGWSWPDHAAAANESRWTQGGRDDVASPARRLFAFEPGRTYRVKVVRNVTNLQLFVDDGLVAEHAVDAWKEIGTRSDRVRTMRLGTGRISLLSWTPLLIDDIVLRGVVQQGWRAEREAALAADEREPR